MRSSTDRSTEAAWTAALGGGLVAALAVWGLLERLRRAVVEVEEGVDAIWTSGKRLAQNTQTTHLLQATLAEGSELLAEVERHKAAGNGGTP